jgi:hypothetical protein
MCYTNKINYPKDYLFSIKELAPIMPEMICQYFMFIRAYGRENASDDIPTGAMSATLLGWKKKISWFMMNGLVPWDDLHSHGNPTRSSAVNDLITTVKRKEARRQGKQSCADHPIEFIQVLNSLHNQPASEFEKKYKYPTFTRRCFISQPVAMMLPTSSSLR